MDQLQWCCAVSIAMSLCSRRNWRLVFDVSRAEKHSLLSLDTCIQRKTYEISFHIVFNTFLLLSNSRIIKFCLCFSPGKGASFLSLFALCFSFQSSLEGSDPKREKGGNSITLDNITCRGLQSVSEWGTLLRELMEELWGVTETENMTDERKRDGML